MANNSSLSELITVPDWKYIMYRYLLHGIVD